MKSTLPDSIVTFIKSHNVMSIATSGDHIWINTVYYVCDDQMRLYFFSSPDTIHGRNISKNKEVALNIFDSHQKVADKKIGVQMVGEVRILNDSEKLQWFFQAWKQIGLAELINYKNYLKKVISGKVYQVTLKKLRFFNEALYEDKESEMFEVE